MDSSELVNRARAVVQREAEAVQALTCQLGASLGPIVECLLGCEGHVLVTGAGTSRAVAERFAHLLSCCGTPALFIGAADSLHGGSGAITSRDVVYVISKGGRSSEILRFADIARERGARVVAQTEDPDTPLAAKAHHLFLVRATGEIDPYGLIATGSSLVNSAACDALCVLLLERRQYGREAFGRTHPEGAVGFRLSQEGSEHSVTNDHGTKNV